MNLSRAIVFFLLLYFISPVYSQIETLRMCPEANHTKLQVKIAVIFDWNMTLTSNNSADISSQFSSSPQAQEVVRCTTALNNDSQILPEHDICLWIVFYRYSLQEVQFDMPILLGRNGIRAVINVIMHELTFSKQTFILRNYFPLVNIKPHTHEECSIDLKDIEEYSNKKENLPSSFTYLDIVPSLMQLLQATRMFTTFMGWQRVGFITECTEKQQKQNGTIFYTVYDSKDFVTMFQTFAMNEIRIFVFVGNLTNYLNLIKTAYKMGVTKQGFVWIYPNISPDLDIIKAINSMNYSAVERQQVYNGLKGTITIHPSGDVNRTIAKTSDSTSSYIDDAIKLLAIAADSFLRKKANETGTALNKTSITWSDSPEYGRQTANTSFTGRTGEISFESNVRNMSVFRFNNIIGCHYMNESGITECNISCIGEIYKGVGENQCKIKFFDDNSTTGFTKQSTVVFSDGTRNIPPDSLRKFIHRTNLTTFLINSSILILFILVFAVCLGIVCFRDIKSMVYDDSWQFTEKVVDYGLEPGIKERLGSNAQDTGQIFDSDPSSTFLTTKVFHNTGRIGGKLVFMKEAKSNVSNLSKKFRRQINQILKIRHQNLCYFLGCIVEGDNIISILHEHCLRGSLHDIIMNEHMELNWKFRLAFINDVAMGLGHLHSCKIINGNLTTKTCVIDSNWVLKLTDYGLTELHEKRQFSKKTNDAFNCVSWEAYECRTLLGGEYSFASDVYCFGMIMKVLGCRNCILMYKDDFKTESIKLMYDEGIPALFVHLLDDCTTSEPKFRAKIDIIKNKLKKMITMVSSDSLGMVEVYSSKLEEIVDKCQEELELEREQSNIIFSYYIPKTAITGIRKTVHTDYKLKEFHQLALLSVGLHDVEKIKENRTKSDIAAIITKIDGIVSGVATTMSLERIQSTGNHWVFVVELYGNLSLNMAVDRAARAAITMTQNFKRTDQLCDVPLQTAIHTGSLMCGFVDNNSFFHVAIGRTLQTLLKVMSYCPDGGIIVTQNVTENLTDEEYNFKFLKIEDTDEFVSAYLLSKQTDASQWSLTDTNKRIKKPDSGFRKALAVEEQSTGVRKAQVIEEQSTGVRKAQVIEEQSTGLRKAQVIEEQSTGLRKAQAVVDEQSTPEKKSSINQKMANNESMSELPDLFQMPKSVDITDK